MTVWGSVRSRRLLSALERIGWTTKRQSGSHRTLARPGCDRKISDGAPTLTWPADAPAELAIHDVKGRRLRRIGGGSPMPGRSDGPLESGGLSPGIYFLVARQNGLRAVARVVVLE